MTLAEQIDELGQRAAGELARLQSYDEHTLSVWRLALKLAEEGRDIGIQSPETGRILEPSELYELSQGYVTRDLAQSVLDPTVSLFEDFLFGRLEAWLTAPPVFREMTAAAIGKVG
jgi:hypothetical protein